MAQIIVQNNEPFDKAMYRFRKYCERENIKSDYMKKTEYVKPSERRRQKEYEARIRRKKMDAKKRRNPWNEPL